MPRNTVLGKPITARQREVLEAYARCGSTQEAAAELFLAEKTVKNTLSEIYAQLGVRRGVTAVWRVFVEQNV